MVETSDNLVPVGAVLIGLQWPDRVRVVRVEPPRA